MAPWLGAEIETFVDQEQDAAAEIQSAATWFIEHNLSKPEQGFQLR
jgi:hypothetical protein